MKINREMEDILGQFFTNHEKLDRMSEQLHVDLSNTDKELSEFYHMVEGTHLSHNTQAHPLMKQLQDILDRRRTLKRDTILVRSFLDNTKKSMGVAKTRTKNAIKRHNTVLDEIETLKTRVKMKKHEL